MENTTPPSSEIEKGKELAALSYLWIFSVIILFARRDNTFIQFHARQGTLLFVLSLIVWPFAGIQSLEFVILAFMILGFIQAAQGKNYSLPLINDLARGDWNAISLRKGWHFLKHNAIRLIKPEHLTPVFREQAKDAHLQELTHRVEEDELKLKNLEDEVRTLENKINLKPL